MQSQLKTYMLLIYSYNVHVLLNNISSSNIYFNHIPTQVQKAQQFILLLNHTFSANIHSHFWIVTITTEQKQYTVLAWRLYCKQNPHDHSRLQVLSCLMPSTSLVSNQCSQYNVCHDNQDNIKAEKHVQLQMSIKTHTTTITMMFQFNYKCSRRVRNAVSLQRQPLWFHASIPQIRLEEWHL
jgi:hypothetical protein